MRVAVRPAARWLTTLAVVLVGSTALRADVTIVQTTTVEGGMAAMAASTGANMSPTQTTRVKGMKSRNDIEAGMINVSTIVDIAAKQIIILRADQKTATVMSTVPAAAPPAASTTTAAASTTSGPSVDGSVKPTGKSQVIDGMKLDEYAFTSVMDMAGMGGGQVPPEAAAALQGLKMQMTGSIWVAKDAPEAAEYLAYQKAVAANDMAGGAAAAAGLNVPGMERMAKAMAGVGGLAYLTEMTMTIDGTGQLAEMMKQMGPMKITVKVKSISGAPIADDLFKVPEGYTVIKQ